MEAKTTANPAGLIYSAIPAIMAEIPSIYKDRKNDAQHYNFRGIDDVYNAVNPILAKYRVFMRADVMDVKREERPSKSGGIMAFVQVRVRYSFVASDGSFVSTDSLGEGMDSGDKATPKAMSIAQKYAILQMFAIPTADPKDPEIDNPEPVKAKPIKPKAAVDPIKAELETDGFAVNAPPVSKFDKLSDFAKAKKSLGDRVYYDCLGQFGYEHANQVPVGQRDAVLQIMRTMYADLHSTAKSPTT
jgi:hypothetical protein